MFRKFIILCICIGFGQFHANCQQASVTSFVDPLIGSEGGGNVFVGPCCPFGIIKPGPDCNLYSNSGYEADLKYPVLGFSQTHVSGTGGGAKYGNIAVMPYSGSFDFQDQSSLRENEIVRLGYYGVKLKKWDIETEITATEKVAFYRFRYNKQGLKALKIDAGHFLYEYKPDLVLADESQFLVGSEIHILSDTEIQGYGRVRGGWNKGDAYTVYFYAVYDKKFSKTATWKGRTLNFNQKSQTDTGEKTGALLAFDELQGNEVKMKIAISYISMAKAKENAIAGINDWDFEAVVKETENKWENKLQKVQLSEKTTLKMKRMFYTGLYHTMLMPVDRSDENPLWKTEKAYYDDYYAIWDTFRSSSPLFTLLYPEKQRDIINSMLEIYNYQGYLPDGRSGNYNGRVQGGSNADVVIADAYVKGLAGIDYKLALQAMLKNAEIAPGGNEEKEGRGGLVDYTKLGYVSTDYARAGSRTVEYAYNDYCIATLANGLGLENIYQKYIRQSGNWKNLWRNDAQSYGSTGFIMPRNSKGNWVDSLPDASNILRKKQFTPHTFQSYVTTTEWWNRFLYEGDSWVYSFYAPHDLPGLIEKCGGADAFKKRLDTFFDKKIYDVSNEPAFLVPTYYHWIGKPGLSTHRIRAIVQEYYNDTKKGIPGNDDSGAMSAWLVFHTLGLFPYAGQSFYMINAPLVEQYTIQLENGKLFTVRAKKFSEKNCYIKSIKLNNKPYTKSTIEHKTILEGGIMELEMTDKPVNFGKLL